MTWKIGEIISRTGLTARALHFYEEQGLIGPISRNKANHRVYSHLDLLKLHRIRALRMLGISVSDMKPMLKNYEKFIPLLKEQILNLQRQREAIEKLINKISIFVKNIETQTLTHSELDDTIFTILEETTMYEKYFTKNEIDEMHSHSQDDKSSSTSEDAWSLWLKSMQNAMEKELNPLSNEVKQLMEQWQQMVKHVTGNNPEKLSNFYKMFHNEKKFRMDHGITDDLFIYMSKATPNH